MAYIVTEKKFEKIKIKNSIFIPIHRSQIYHLDKTILVFAAVRSGFTPRNPTTNEETLCLQTGMLEHGSSLKFLCTRVWCGLYI